MKKLLSSIALLALILSASAQKEITPRPMNADKGTYLGIGLGVNDATGLIGIRLDSKISPKIMLGVGAGLGGWGGKISFTGTYQTESNWNPFVSFTRSSGLDSITLSVDARKDNGPVFKQNVTFQYYAVNTLNLGVQKQWFTQRGHRFFLNLGYAFSMNTGKVYDIKSANTVLTDESRAILKTSAPGGVIIGVGYQFKLR